MRKIIFIGGILACAALLAWGGRFYWKNLRGVWPAVLPASPNNGTAPPAPAGNTSDGSDAPEGANATGMPLRLPRGFSISIFAKNLPGARVMAFDQFGNMWVSRTSAGAIATLEIDRETGAVRRQQDVFRNLKNPHGLAFDPDSPNLLYFAEEDKITRVTLYSDDPGQKIADLPSGGGHFTRTIGFGPDKRLYVSIGSSCNVCIESDDRRAKIFSMNPDGSDVKEFARGLRNAVFFAWHPRTGKMWATEMGRDLLGDNIPPDEVNILEEGKNYGWPNCYGKNIHDAQFDKNTYIRNPCMEPFESASFIDIPAHSAPLGLAFVPESGAWPKEYANDLFAAYHGSWNRSTPTGYKIVRIPLDRDGRFENPSPDGTPKIEDFITGWLSSPTRVAGRPAGITIHGNAMYISDDKAGVIYKVEYRSK